MTTPNRTSRPATPRHRAFLPPWWSFTAALVCGCGTILGVDDFSVDPNFDAEDASSENEPEPSAPRPSFRPDDDADDDVDDADDDVDDADDDVDDADDDVDDDADDDVDDDSDDDLGDDDADDDADDDVGDDDLSPEAGADDDVGDDNLSPEAGADDDADDDVSEPCFAPISGTCGVVPQCGCGADNCEFDLDNTGATSCVPSGDVPPYAECGGTASECQAGHSCVAGLCKAFCSGEEPQCEQGEFATCHEVTDGTDPIPGFFVCARTCDPRDPTSAADGFLPCGPDVACIPAPNGTSNCFVPDTPGSVGSDCTGSLGTADSFLCGPGLGCSDATTPPTCQPYCEVGSTDCGPGAECVPTTPATYAGELEMGTCYECPNVGAGDECANFPQCGCGDGQMCYDGQCVPEGSLGLNESCELDQLCGAGLECIVYGDNPIGVCTQYCTQTADCPNANSLCFEGLDPPVCLWGCDPRDPTNGSAPFAPCGDEQVCIPGVAGDSACTPGAIWGDVGEYCVDHDECGPGLGCDALWGWCTAWCQVGTLDCVTASTSCFDDGSVTSAGQAFGLCLEAIMTVSSTDTPLVLEDLATTQSVISIPSYEYTFERVTVEVELTHTFLGDLSLELLAPNGTTVPLATASMSGNGTISLRFDDAGATLANPYQGAYQPETPLEVLSGLPLTGDWTLIVSDGLPSDTGTLVSWRLHFW